MLAAAVITEKKINSDGEETSSCISYTFDSEGLNAAMVGNRLVTQGHYDALSVGDRLTVLYNAQQPHIHLIYQFASYRAIGRGGA